MIDDSSLRAALSDFDPLAASLTRRVSLNQTNCGAAALASFVDRQLASEYGRIPTLQVKMVILSSMPYRPISSSGIVLGIVRMIVIYNYIHYIIVREYGSPDTGHGPRLEAAIILIKKLGGAPPNPVSYIDYTAESCSVVPGYFCYLNTSDCRVQLCSCVGVTVEHLQLLVYELTRLEQ